MKRSLPIQLIVLTYFFLSHHIALAQPTINTVSGDVEKDQIITLTGSGFSTPSLPVTQMWDTVDNQKGDEYTSPNKVPITDEYLWSGENTTWGTPFTIAVDENNNEYYKGEGYRHFVGWPRVDRSSTPNTIYVSWRYKPSIDPYGQGGSNKFIRIWDDPNGTGSRISWTANQFYCNNYGVENVSPATSSWVHWTVAGNIGKWNRNEIYVDYTTGEATIWVNGIVLKSLTGCYKSENNYPLMIGLIGFDHNADAYRDMETSMDDIYMSGTLARVEISNNDKYVRDDTRQIQPIESWDDGTITFSFFPGIIDTTKKMYLYVFDKNNVVNETGFLLCPTCPQQVKFKKQ